MKSMRGFTEAERFWAKVQRTDGCWFWMGGKNRGYGKFHVSGRSLKAHRYAYELLVASIPNTTEDEKRITLDHLCRTKECVNPAHLEPVTIKENVLRGESFSAINARKTHCPQGHEYTPENTNSRPSKPGRYCRACAKAGSAESRRRQAVTKRLVIEAHITPSEGNGLLPSGTGQASGPATGALEGEK